MKKIGNFKKFGISIIGILLILVLAFLILNPKSNADDNAIVRFECKNLKKELNLRLFRSADSDITIKDMHGLNGHLNLNNRGITTLMGIEHLINVTGLNLSGNQIYRIEEFLDKLTNLTYLDLGFNQISRIEHLDKLTNLTYLNLGPNQISKIEGLDKLTNLTELKLNDNKISKIEGLGSLTKLKELDLSDNQISMIEGLGRLTKLTKLSLDRNQISNVEVFDNLTDFRVSLCYQNIFLNINSNEFEVPKVMYGYQEIVPTISDEFLHNIRPLGENRYRIDDEGIKKLKEKQAIFKWYIRGLVIEHPDIADRVSEFSGEIYAISTPKEKDSFNEEMVKNKCVKVGEKLDIATLLLNKPNGSRVEVVEDINTNTLGKKRGKIKVIFSDGSFKEIEVEVIVNIFNVQINYLDKKGKIVKSEEKEVEIDPKKLNKM